MNDSRGNYLKAIYEECKSNPDRIATNRALAEKLNVSPASISEMISKFTELGLTENIPYKGFKLTQIGIKECVKIIRSHRLWEVFLIKCLNYTWSEAHEDAHLLEHATTERMINRLDEFLNYPEYCPHGCKIPKLENYSKEEYESVIEDALITLNMLNVNSKGIISKIIEDSKLLDYLWDLGLEIGKEVCIIAKGDYEGPITLIQDGKEFSISYKATTQIFVKSVGVY